MKIWTVVAVFVVAVFLIGHKSLNLGGLKLPQMLSSQDGNIILGRWDQVGSTGFIRFCEDGYYRGDFSGAQRTGTYSVLEGGAIELTVSFPVRSGRGNKITAYQDVREYKYTLAGDILKLRIGSLWVAFKKARDASEEPFDAAPVLITVPPPAAKIPAKKNERLVPAQ